MSRKRGLIASIFYSLFKNSFIPKQSQRDAIFKGRDHWGTEYYEYPPDPSRGKYKPRRMFTNPKYEDEIDIEVPNEWQAWLRMRRNDPPTQEELDRNYALMLKKKQNAASIEEKEKEKFPEYSKKVEEIKKKQVTSKLHGGDLNFPVYGEYSTDPLKPVQTFPSKNERTVRVPQLKDTKDDKNKDKEQ